jgi:hypothetical protein
MRHDDPSVQERVQKIHERLMGKLDATPFDPCTIAKFMISQEEYIKTFLEKTKTEN